MTLGRVVLTLVLLFETFMLLRLVLPFFPSGDRSAVTSARSLSFRITDPVVAPLRRALPPLPGAAGGFGLAELLILIGLSVIINILIRGI